MKGFYALLSGVSLRISPRHLFLSELVTEVYPCKPQVVEHKVLPLLWHLLSTSTHKGSTLCRSGSLSSATTKLCQALYAQMGPSLTDLSASQSATVHVLLNDILRTVT